MHRGHRSLGPDPGDRADRADTDLPRIFTAFFRGERSRSRETGGVGLGLTLARCIVEAHGGTIDVTSTPNRGPSVRVTIPA